MKNTATTTPLSRILSIIAGLLIAVAIFVPLWRIELDAPQYPEGLALIISANNIGGDVNTINGLNHYIGMKTLHTEDFIEFTILPYILAAFALLFSITGVAGKRFLLVIATYAFIIFGILSMVDFYQWNYNYGHNLNPDAAIRVPGMAYQP
ncbi:MAG: hypothetical protein JNL32_00885, partial [Candidatus Kapabacteria bacterium]|nr:hypothetical protein [Candidatus Kapabacteria bacterium]